MLKEVSMEQAFEAYKRSQTVVVLHGGMVRSFTDLMNDMRFLIDQQPGTTQKVEVPAKRSKEQEILAAWKGGERSAKEIMEITGASYATVRKYIPGEDEKE